MGSWTAETTRPTKKSSVQRNAVRSGGRGQAPPPSLRSLGTGSDLLGHEPLAGVRQPCKERSRPPGSTVLALELEHPVLERLEAHLLRPEHRAAPVDGPTVTADPDHVDVARADRELL